MRRLQRPKRVDSLRSEVRTAAPKRQRLGKFVYWALLILFFGYVFDLLVGGRFYLSADGMVMRDARTIGRDFSASVAAMAVDSGEQVVAGQLLMQLESTDMLNNLATRHSELLRLEGEIAEVRSRQDEVAAKLPDITQYVTGLKTSLDNYRALGERGLSTEQQRLDAEEDYYTGRAELTSLELEAKRLDEQIPRYQALLQSAQDTVNRLSRSYDKGQVFAPIDGTVNKIHINVGEAVDAGDEILTLHHGPRFVLAYLPIARFFEINPGDPVIVQAGNKVMLGQVQIVYALAPALPEEFGAVFGVEDRRQLVLIALADEFADPAAKGLPPFSPVTITRRDGPITLVKRQLNGMIHAIQDWRESL